MCSCPAREVNTARKGEKRGESKTLRCNSGGIFIEQVWKVGGGGKDLEGATVEWGGWGG